MAEKDVVDAEKIFLAVGAGTFLTIATVFAVQALYYWGDRRDFAQKNYQDVTRELKDNQSRALEQISSVKPLEGGRFQIPIDHAEKLVLQELSTR